MGSSTPPVLQRRASSLPAGVQVLDQKQAGLGVCRVWLSPEELSPAPAGQPPDQPSVSPPAGGFATFSSCFPGLCEGKPATLPSMSLSQPCLPVPSVGLTRILPHLYLGSQKDVLNKVSTQRVTADRSKDWVALDLGPGRGEI